MTPSLPTDQRDVIVAHKHDTVLFVAAESAPCTATRDALVDRIPAPRTTKKGVYGGRVVAVDADELGSIETDASWCLAMLVCPGDRLERLVAWARGRLEAAHFPRIRFYVDPGVDVVEAVTPWTSNVSPVADAVQPEDENVLTRATLSQPDDQIYADFAPHKPPGVS